MAALALLSGEAGYQNVFVILPGPAAGTAVYVAAVTLLELQPRRGKNIGVEAPPIVDDDQDRGAGLERRAQILEHRSDSLRVVRERCPRGAARGRPQLLLAQIVEPEQFVGVAVLLVVVDQARVGRRGDDAVEGGFQPDRARVSVQDVRRPAAGAQALELLDSL